MPKKERIPAESASTTEDTGAEAASLVSPVTAPRWAVSLKHNPTLVFVAPTAEDAVKEYKQYCSIIQSDHPFEVTPADADAPAINEPKDGEGE